MRGNTKLKSNKVNKKNNMYYKETCFNSIT